MDFISVAMRVEKICLQFLTNLASAWTINNEFVLNTRELIGMYGKMPISQSLSTVFSHSVALQYKKGMRF